MTSASLFVTQLLNGLTLGILYLLIAAGLSVIFGMTDIINFAHGAMYMLGAYLGLSVIDVTGSFWLALLVAPVLVGVLGGVIERLTLHRIYDRDPLYHIILTFGVMLMITEGVEYLWGSQPQQFSTPEILSGSAALELGSIAISYPVYKLFLVAAGATVAGLVWALFRYTEFGLIVRAGAQNPDTVRLLGIDVSNYFTLVFALGAGLAGAAGVLAAPFLSVSPTMGDSILIIAFITVVVGGLGSFRGSAIAAILIGLVESLGNVFVPQLTGFSVYLLMILVLLLRPQGLLGEYKVRDASTKVSFDEVIPPIRLTSLPVLATLGVLALVPFGIDVIYTQYYVGLLSLIFIWALLALSLDIVMGYMGLLSFGHAAFWGIGAYVTVYATVNYVDQFLFALVLAALACGVVAWGIGALSIRLTGVYFAMITLAFAELFHQVAVTWSEVTGGVNGLLMPIPSMFGIDLGDTTAFYYLTLVVMVLTYAAAVRVLDSPFGRVVKAIRESERRTASLGYDTNKFKRRAFAFSGIVGGLAGGLFAGYNWFVSPEALHWTVSGDAVVAMMLGGMGTLFGPMIGAGVFIGISEGASAYVDNWRFFLGLFLVLIVMFAPRGIASLPRVVAGSRLGGRLPSFGDREDPDVAGYEGAAAQEGEKE
ncbi:ABC transporter permease [Halostella litorea]|uniref:ABC transporter permease n=1 Tax=Halostella litorea TaxID=2528831 RepID=UPI001092AD6C|nr:ABC transporter permease [Halostella litorea]